MSKADQRPEPTARLMLSALRRFEHELQDKLYKDGFEDVSVAHSNVLRHLNPEGMRLAELAADAGITKQGASQAVRALEQRDLVTVEADPSDRRAKRVVYTERGRSMIRRSIRHIAAIENRWRRELGEREFENLRDVLRKLGSLA